MDTLVNRYTHRECGREPVSIESSSKETLIGTAAGLQAVAGGRAIPDSLAGYAELCDDLSQASPLVPAGSAERPGVALGKVLGALHALRGEPSAVRVIERAAHELCACGLFDRVMLSLVRGSTWLPQARYAYGSSGRVHRELTLPDDLAIPLASPLLEAEVVRRRLPALVENAETESRLYRPLIERTGITQFVVAPVVAESSVIALLHGEIVAGGRSLTTIDRDLLRMFSDGVGVMYERACLAERIELQRAAVAEAFGAAADFLQQMDARPPMAFTGPVLRAAQAVDRDRPAVEARAASRLTRLTAREREVLALLSSGATNSQLADRLTVAESTVKSHVKHILHKLGARNRAEAIACYMRETRGDERRPR